MSKFIASEINDEGYDALMMICTEEGKHPSTILREITEEFLIRRGTNSKVKEVVKYMLYELYPTGDNPSEMERFEHLLSLYGITLEQFDEDMAN